MNKNILIVLAGGFLVAVLVAVLVQSSLGGKKEEKEVVTQVLVAAKNLPIGTKLDEANMKWKDWDKDKEVSTNDIVRKDEEQKTTEVLKGRLIVAVEADQPLLTAYTTKDSKVNTVAATLGKGMRAVSIPVKAYTMAGGFVTPGDYVDVILTYSVSTNAKNNPGVAAVVNKRASETILQNLKVLAVDQEAVREEDKAKIAKTVTLEVSADGSEKLALASKMGDITLALRGIGDGKINTESLATTDVELGQIMKNVADIEYGEKEGAEIRVYNGNQETMTTPRNQTSKKEDESASTVTDETGEAEDPETVKIKKVIETLKAQESVDADQEEQP